MKREITEKLISWKHQKDRKPLILKGVRQCGKTYALKDFGTSQYTDLAYFNFEETPALGQLFDQDYDVKRILLELGIFRGKTIKPGETLLILDEIQACGKALTALKYFCENAREYHVACAGSLLGIAIHQDQSFPVGKVDFLDLYPMSFYEFLDAMGEDALAGFLKDYRKGAQLSDLMGGKLKTLLKQYYVTGGMPEVVDAWRQTKDIGSVETIQRQILSSYELDFVKHASSKEYPKLAAIWTSIPQQLAKSNHKFIFGQVKKGWRAKDLEDALQWLVGAGLVYKVCRIEKPFLPLSSYADASSFKVYLCDVGLLRCLARLPAQIVLDASNIYTEFKGAMTENYVLNELVKSVDPCPYYWTSGNSAEVDFVIQKDMHIIPIEVKAEENVRARSLAEYRKKYQPEFSVKTSMRNETNGVEIKNIPLYMMASLENFLIQ